MKMKLYEILKNFVEKEAHIRMPKLEKCEYFEMTGIYHDDTMSEWCSDNNKQCENCKNHSCYQTYIESISIEHKNEKRKIEDLIQHFTLYSLFYIKSILLP